MLASEVAVDLVLTDEPVASGLDGVRLLAGRSGLLLGVWTDRAAAPGVLGKMRPEFLVIVEAALRLRREARRDGSLS